MSLVAHGRSVLAPPTIVVPDGPRLDPAAHLPMDPVPPAAAAALSAEPDSLEMPQLCRDENVESTMPTPSAEPEAKDDDRPALDDLTELVARLHEIAEEKAPLEQERTVIANELRILRREEVNLRKEMMEIMDANGVTLHRVGGTTLAIRTVDKEGVSKRARDVILNEVQDPSCATSIFKKLRTTHASLDMERV